MENPESMDPVSSLLTEFNTRLNELEEKQRLIKDRTLLIGENLVSTKDGFAKQTAEFNGQLKQMKSELESLKRIITKILGETEDFARKSELDILQHQAKIFQPLEFARLQDVKNIIKEELLNKNIKTRESS